MRGSASRMPATFTPVAAIGTAPSATPTPGFSSCIAASAGMPSRSAATREKRAQAKP